MSSYFTKFTGLTLDNLHDTLSAVSNIVAPIADDEEIPEDDTNDIRDFANTLSQMGDLVKSTLGSTLPISSDYEHSEQFKSQPQRNEHEAQSSSGYITSRNDVSTTADNSFEEITLNTPDKDAAYYKEPQMTQQTTGFLHALSNATGLNRNALRNVEEASSWDWGTPDIASKGGTKGRATVVLDSSELEKNVQLNYQVRMETEVDRLSNKVSALEEENNILKAAKASALASSYILGGKEVAILQDELAESKAQAIISTNIQRQLEDALTSRDNVIKALESEVASVKATSSASLTSDSASAAEIAFLKHANSKCIENIEELENIVSLSKAENAELMFAIDVEQKNVKKFEISMNNLSETICEQQRSLAEATACLTSQSIEYNSLVKQFEDLKHEYALKCTESLKKTTLDEDVDSKHALEMSELQTKCDADIDQAFKEIEDLRSSLEQALDECNIATERLYDEQYEHNTKLSKVEDELSSCRNELSEAKLTIEKLTNAISGTDDARFTALNESLVHKSSELGELHTLYKTKTVEWDELKASLNHELYDLQEQNHALETNRLGLESSLVHLESDALQLREAIAKYENDMSKIDAEGAVLDENRRLTNELNERCTEINELKIELERLSEAAASAATHSVDYTFEIERLTLKSEFAAADTERMSLEQKQLEANLIVYQETVESLRNALDKQNDKENDAAKAVESKDTECQELRDVIVLLRQQLQEQPEPAAQLNDLELQNNFNSKCAENSKLVEAITLLQLNTTTSLDLSKAEINDLKAQLVQSQAAVKQLQHRETTLVSEDLTSKELILRLRQSVDELTKHEDSKEDSRQQQLQEAKSLQLQITKAETENRQLHQVILQLRNVRKVSKDDVEGLQQDRDKLKDQCESLKAENTRLSDAYKLQASSLASSNELQDKINDLQDKLLEYEEARTQGMHIIDEKKREVARLEKLIYDKDVATDGANSTILMLTQDLDRKELELQNLHNALGRIAIEQEHLRRSLQTDFERKLKAVESKHQLDLKELEAIWGERILESQKKITFSEQLHQDAVILQRKAELDLMAEKKKMQKTVESAISSLRNTQDDVVDRGLVANLVVSYFKKNRSREVMDLIAKVLNFNDDQKVIVGLKVGAIGFRHAVGSIFKTIVGGPSTKSSAEIEGENLAELWVNFLLEETKKDDEKGSKSSRSPSKLSIPKMEGYGSDDKRDDHGHESDMGSFSLTPTSPTFSKTGGAQELNGWN